MPQPQGLRAARGAEPVEPASVLLCPRRMAGSRSTSSTPPPWSPSHSLVGMKRRANMKRVGARRGTDLQDIARLILDEQARPAALAELGSCDAPTAGEGALHVCL